MLQRRLEILEDFDREIYGRVPNNVTSVTWDVMSEVHETIGNIPVLKKQLPGHVNNDSDPLIDV